MVILGGISHFWGPAVGAAILILLNQHINAYTQYWPLILGSILIVLVFVFPTACSAPCAPASCAAEVRDA